MLGWLRRNKNASQVIRKNGEFLLVRTPDGLMYWLTPESYVDRSILEKGVFEPYSTSVVRELVKPGFVVMDVGANIGYYSVLFASLVGQTGRVVSFEPTSRYLERLQSNILENGFSNIDVREYGLSAKNIQTEIFCGECSATLHWIPDHAPKGCEYIELKRLDDVATELGLTRLDFVKVDIDGHEPAFLDGAWNTLEKFQPIVLLEVSHAHYLEYGITAWDFYHDIISRGYRIYSEKGLKELRTKNEFLIECGNFTHSANILIAKAGKLDSYKVNG